MIFCCHDILSIFHYMLSQLHILQILKIYGLKEVLLYFWVFFITVKLFLSFEEMEQKWLIYPLFFSTGLSLVYFFTSSYKFSFFLDLIDYGDAKGFTPLMHAVFSKSMSCLRILLQFGSKPEIIDGKGRTALHFCARKVCSFFFNCSQPFNNFSLISIMFLLIYIFFLANKSSSVKTKVFSEFFTGIAYLGRNKQEQSNHCLIAYLIAFWLCSNSRNCSKIDSFSLFYLSK